MKIEFRGWAREMVAHKSAVTPVKKWRTQYMPLDPDDGVALVWENSSLAYGKLNQVALNGAFLVAFQFEEGELRNWLLTAAKENPEEIIKLVAEAQAVAITTLAKAS